MRSRRSSAAFTLVELLAVILIVGVIAGLTLPLLRNIRKGDSMLSATRQMLDAVGRARQLAISQHTTVFMVFAPPTLWSDPFYNNLSVAVADRVKATNVLDKQLTGYNFVTMRSVGDQPGASSPRYLASWQSLPDSAFIPVWKFNLGVNQIHFVNNAVTGESFPVTGFTSGNLIPFPSEDVYYYVPPLPLPHAFLPYIAFNYLGQLSTQDGDLLGRDEYIPLAHGSVQEARDPATKGLLRVAPSALEAPEGSSTNSSFILIHIDRLTGRAKLERQATQ